MYTGSANLIIKEMQDKGFTAKQLGFGVVVSLNREISTAEVETALNDAFQGILFNLEKVNKNQVMIKGR